MRIDVVRKEGETGGKGYSKLRMIDKDKKKLNNYRAIRKYN